MAYYRCADFPSGDCGNEYLPDNEDRETSSEQGNLLERLLRLFKKGTTLSKDDQKKLERAYAKMREDCIYEYIDNYLRNQGVALGSIYMAELGWMGQAAVTNSGDLKFADSNEITAEALKHEWFHLYQKEYHGLSSFTEPGMMEWEQALFQDILMYIELKGDLSTSTHAWACYSWEKDSYKNDYQEWLSTLTNGGTSFPSKIDDSNFEHFADVFGDVSRPYNTNRGYNYSNTSYKPTAIQSIFAAAQQHCH